MVGQDLLVVLGILCIAFVLMLGVVFCLGRGRIYAVGIMAFYGVGMLLSGEIPALGWPPALVLPVTALTCGLLALAHYPMLSRFRGDGFIVLNLLLLVAVRELILRRQSPMGLILKDDELPVRADQLVAATAITLVIAVAAGICFRLLSRGEWRRRWLAHGQGLDELVAAGGIAPRRLTVLSFVLGGALAGSAGVLGAWLHHGTEPAQVSVLGSLVLFAYVFVGGMSLLGAMIGAAFYVLLPIIVQEIFATGASGTIAARLREILVGLLLILVVRFSPAGLAGDSPPFLPEGRENSE